MCPTRDSNSDRPQQQRNKTVVHLVEAWLSISVVVDGLGSIIHVYSDTAESIYNGIGCYRISDITVIYQIPVLFLYLAR